MEQQVKQKKPMTDDKRARLCQQFAKLLTDLPPPALQHAMDAFSKQYDNSDPTMMLLDLGMVEPIFEILIKTHIGVVTLDTVDGDRQEEILALGKLLKNISTVAQAFKEQIQKMGGATTNPNAKIPKILFMNEISKFKQDNLPPQLPKDETEEPAPKKESLPQPQLLNVKDRSREDTLKEQTSRKSTGGQRGPAAQQSFNESKQSKENGGKQQPPTANEGGHQNEVSNVMGEDHDSAKKTRNQSQLLQPSNSKNLNQSAQQVKQQQQSAKGQPKEPDANNSKPQIQAVATKANHEGNGQQQKQQISEEQQRTASHQEDKIQLNKQTTSHYDKTLLDEDVISSPDNRTSNHQPPQIQVDQSSSLQEDRQPPINEDVYQSYSPYNKEPETFQEEVQEQAVQHHQSHVQPKPKKPVDIAKLKERGLQEIFNFYSKQHVMHGNKMSFDEIGKESNLLAYGDYIKLCQDFGFNVKKDTLTDLYRLKVKRGAKELEYSTFKELMADIFKSQHEETVSKKKQELEMLKLRALDQRMERRKQKRQKKKDEDDGKEQEEEGPADENHNNVDDDLEAKINELIADVENSDASKEKPQEYYIEQVHQFLQSWNRAAYMQKMKGFHRAFGGTKLVKDPKNAHLMRDEHGIQLANANGDSGKLGKSISTTRQLPGAGSQLKQIKKPSLQEEGQEDPINQEKAVASQKNTGVRSSLELKAPRDVKSSLIGSAAVSPGVEIQNQPYHIKDQLLRMQKTKELEERQRIREEALMRIRGIQRGDSKVEHDGELILDDNYKDRLGQQNTLGHRNTAKKHNSLTGHKQITLEQLRNIQNTKDLFTKEDEEKFNMMLGIGDDSSPKNSIRQSSQLKSPLKQPQQYVRPKDSASGRALINASQLRNQQQQQSQTQQHKSEMKKASVRSDPDYIDQRSMEYHRKILNRAQEIEDSLINKKAAKQQRMNEGPLQQHVRHQQQQSYPGISSHHLLQQQQLAENKDVKRLQNGKQQQQ